MRKGFTLIELLAVIVILAIIALIATPIVLNIIEDSKNSSMLRSSEMYLDAVEYSIARGVLNNIRVENDTYNILTNGNICIEYDGSNCKTELEVEVKGEKPISGTITIEGGAIKNHTLTYESNIIIVDGKLQHTDSANNDNIENMPAFAKAIINKAKENNYYYTKAPDFSKVTQEGEYGLYKTLDDLGTSYYFRGDTEDNYVQFGVVSYWDLYYSEDDDDIADDYTGARFSSEELCENSELYNDLYADHSVTCKKIASNEPMYWRIIRINGDNSIRMIYSGIQKIHNGEKHDAKIGNVVYSNIYEADGGYIYNYYLGGEKESYVKIALDDWYESVLKNKYSLYINDSIFCNDMNVSEILCHDDDFDNPVIVDKNSECEIITYYYGTTTRLVSRNPSPELMCKRTEDKYTLNTSIGNGKLDNPIGLITADEIYMAGGVYNNANKTNYLYSGEAYWSLTPYRIGAGDTSAVNMFHIDENGRLGAIFVDDEEETEGVRPVINLKADVKFTGDGSYDNPYVIVTE